MGGVFFCKKWTFPQRRVHYVQYQYFYFTFYLFGGVCTQRTPPAYGPEESYRSNPVTNLAVVINDVQFDNFHLAVQILRPAHCPHCLAHAFISHTTLRI